MRIELALFPRELLAAGKAYRVVPGERLPRDKTAYPTDHFGVNLCVRTCENNVFHLSSSAGD